MEALDFINKEIEATKRSHKAFELDYELFHRESDNRDAENLIKKLNNLQQIKVELEAWEIVKHLIYKRKMGEKLFIQVMGGSYNEGECWTSGINPYEILKKALEVKDE